ncbi:MAG: stage II sporulation protein M, partial [Treponema sp.]|nr:stage II sporulation protein M [Treponema sp.]
MTEQVFIKRREHIWTEFSKLILGGKSALKNKAPEFVLKFREITQDLNNAKAYGFDPVIIERLNTLVNEGNQILYARRSWTAKTLLAFIWQVFPQKVRLQWRGILAVTLLFYGIGLFFMFLCLRFPDVAEEFVSSSQLTQIEEMYDPENERYLQPREVSGDADMFGFYIYNNISIAFRIFAGGILAGFGSLLLLCYNAVFLGIIEGHMINAGFSKTFFPFVIAHSSFELTAIVFSAYAGMLLGYSFFFTKGLTRGASVRKAGQDAFPIIAGSTLMLVIAAAIEAFWSSKDHFPFMLRISVGASLWILLLLYFLFAGR